MVQKCDYRCLSQSGVDLQMSVLTLPIETSTISYIPPSWIATAGQTLLAMHRRVGCQIFLGRMTNTGDEEHCVSVSIFHVIRETGCNSSITKNEADRTTGTEKKVGQVRKNELP